MFRASVLIVLLICFVSFAKVGYHRVFPAKQQQGEAAKPPRDVWEADGRLLSFPTAALSKWDDIVKSPYRDRTYLSIKHLAPGQLVRCGKSNQPFYIPFRKGLEYGNIAGDWHIQRFERARTIEYDVRIKAQLQGFTGEGKRMRENGRQLPPEEQTRITLKRMRFENDVFHCDFEEQRNISNTVRGRFQWQFSSAQDMLQGEAILADGLRTVVSQGSRYAGSRGEIPASVSTADALVPNGWRLLDKTDGQLTSGGGRFIAIVAEEPGANPRRWLIIAQREGSQGKCQTILATSYACRDRTLEGQADPFHGIALPNPDFDSRPGEFVLRHHITLDDLHQGEDLWFRYADNNKEWRFVEGIQYGYQLRPGTTKMNTWPLKPGATLAEFRIDTLQRVNPKATPQNTPPYQSLPTAPKKNLPYIQRPMAQVSDPSQRLF